MRVALISFIPLSQSSTTRNTIIVLIHVTKVGSGLAIDILWHLDMAVQSQEQ